MSKVLNLTCALLAAAVVLTGCGGPSDSDAKSGGGKAGGKEAAKAQPGKKVGGEVKTGKPITVYLIPKELGVPYFTSCAAGATEAEKELGNVHVVYNGPEDGKAEHAAGIIDQAILKRADVVAVSASDPSVVGPSMKKALGKGIDVITWDADTSPDTREYMVLQATSKEIGYALVDAMAKDLGGDKATGDVAIITADLNSANQNDWMKYMKERLPKYKGLNLVDMKPAGEDQKLAFSIAQDLMKAYPKLKGIFAISSVAFPGAAEAVEQANKTGQVLVTGLGTPNDMKAHVMSGSVKTVILWNTQDLGYLTVYAARALADGVLKPGVTSLKAGRLGEIKVEGDMVLLGGIMTFTKENIGKFNF